MIITKKMTVVCLDFEGVLIPEIWKGLAQLSSIEELELTTRDIADYDELMRYRLKICDQFNLTLRDIHKVVKQMKPLEGAFEFLTWLRQRNEVIILSDTFREFVEPLLHKLQYPTVLCHSLKLDDDMRIVDYCLRQKDQKRYAVKAFKEMNYYTVAVGDSYNDISMLQEADQGVFFRPTKKIVAEHPDFPVAHEYPALQITLEQISNNA